MKRQRLSRCRPRLSELPAVITVCLAIPLLILAWQTGIDLEISFGGTSAEPSSELDHGDALTKGSIQPVSCVQVIEQAHMNSTDANRNRLFLRLIDEEPRFWISLHAKGYDKVRWGVMEHGRYYEQIESRCFREVLANSSRPRVIDVGGNIGWYTLLSASMGAKVDVFEPNPKNFLRMCESICVNGWVVDGRCINIGNMAVQGSNRNGRVRIFPIGIGSGASSAFFQTGLASRNNPGAGAIVEAHLSPSLQKKYTSIQIMPLDEMARQLGWYDEMIDIMKIDVEGYEIHVVRGAKELLRSNRIKNIFMEGDVSGQAMQKRFQELVRTFADAGYIVFKIGGFSGPIDTDVPPMDENIERSLATQCAGKKQKRKKCNLWWKLASER